jgi:D-lactate dehydrogenase (cytochrome)
MAAVTNPNLIRPSPEALSKAIAELQASFGNRAVTSTSVREQHAHTTTWIENQPPDVVVFPQNRDDIQTTVKIAIKHRIPVIPFGTGTSLEGHVNAPIGGISIDTSMMKSILKVNAEDLDCVVEPGVTRKELNDYLRSYGLFFPVDPGADASIGGMTATRASGTNAVRYGTMKELVMALEVITADGEILTTARRARKSAAGYDLTHLFVGSEGTLGVITKITLKLFGLPESVSAAACSFPSIRQAADASILAIQSGLPIARIELIDAFQVKASNAYSKLTLPEVPHLLLEFHGTESSVQEQAERFGEIARDCGGGASYQTANKPEERTKLWQARHDAYWALTSYKAGWTGVATDACVPLSRLAECIEKTREDMDSNGIIGSIIGHVGDGNFHVTPLLDKNDAEMVKKVEDFIDRLVIRTLAMEGTCTGEHGIGQGKISYLEAELGKPAVMMMKALKQAIDPLNLMNPGKIFL